MYFVTKRMEFDAGHRLFGYKGPCARLHGHHYVVEVTIQGDDLDSLGMLMDFGDLKSIISRHVDAWDHHTLLHPEDDLRASIPPDNIVLMSGGNPTAENMVRELHRAISQDVLSTQPNISVSHIRLYETPDCWVDYF